MRNEHRPPPSTSTVTVNAAGRDRNVYPPSPARPLRQLPAPLRDVRGRAQEREHLVLALGIPAGQTAAIATIQGMGGENDARRCQ